MSYTIRMESELFTVSQLAEIIAAARDARDVDLLTRRLRHWTLTGALSPVGSVHGGTGRRRRYGRETAYVAAVLNVLADRGLPIGVIKSVGTLLPDVIRQDPSQDDLWRSAKSRECPVFLSLLHYFAEDRAPDHQVIAVVLGTLDETMNSLLVGEGAEIINLTNVFNRLFD